MLKRGIYQKYSKYFSVCSFKGTGNNNNRSFALGKCYLISFRVVVEKSTNVTSCKREIERFDEHSLSALVVSLVNIVEILFRICSSKFYCYFYYFLLYAFNAILDMPFYSCSLILIFITLILVH